MDSLKNQGWNNYYSVTSTKGRQIIFGSSYQEVKKIEGTRNTLFLNSTLHLCEKSLGQNQWLWKCVSPARSLSCKSDSVSIKNFAQWLVLKWRQNATRKWNTGIALYCETLGEKKQLMLKIKICHFASLFRCDTFES